ncbi:MAG: hypothetical protein EU539_07215 [Promethearchaeota archaeon]|nr:MAG: hypothetical protein EU539_07215 [Candidatus Lokiarchaeota archaeon]
MEGTNKVIINVNSELKPINPMIYGNFIEHIGECIHNGIWTYDPVNVPLIGNEYPRIKKVRKDLLNALKKVKPTVLRAFGGCYSDVYHWKDAIGPEHQRKSVKNIHWGIKEFENMDGVGPIIENQFGTDEFLSLCEIIGAKPYLNVNYGSGTPQEAADWVEYCNGSVDTEYGALRAQYGRNKPYDVKIWGIANEIYGFWEVGYEKIPEDYAENYLKFAKKMREKDETIKLVACGYQNPSWNQAVLKNIGNEWVDYMSIHLYLPYVAGGRDKENHPDNEKCYHALMASPQMVEEQINAIWNDIITTLGKETDVRIAFDEWGLWYLNSDVIKTNFNLQDGIWATLILMLFQRKSAICPLANWAQLVNCIGIIQTDPDGLVITPVALAFQLFADHVHDNLVSDVFVHSSTFSSNKFGSIIKYKNVPYIECNCTINDDGNNLSIMLVNKHINENLKVNLEINHFLPNEKGKIIKLASDSPFDYNTTENRNKIKITEKIINDIKPNMAITLEPHSVTILKLTKNNS